MKSETSAKNPAKPAVPVRTDSTQGTPARSQASLGTGGPIAKNPERPGAAGTPAKTSDKPEAKPGMYAAAFPKRVPTETKPGTENGQFTPQSNNDVNVNLSSEKDLRRERSDASRQSDESVCCTIF